MRRATAGRAARAAGAAWEAAIRADLAGWVEGGTLRDYQQQGPLYQRVGAGGLRVIPIEAEGPVDFLAWDGSVAWAWEAKATTRHRWPLSGLESHQARRLTTWHMPSAGRVAGVALRYDAEGLALWLPWAVLAPLWGRWATGGAGRGEASLTAEQAARLGVPWGDHWSSR